MKKLLTLALALFIIVSAVGCMDLEYGDESQEIADGTGNSSGSADVTDTEAVKSELPTIEEQVCFENDGIKVTAKSMVDDSIWGQGIKFLIENTGSKTYTVSLHHVIVNDCMISSYFSSEVAGGKKANETLTFSSSELETAGITDIGKIELYFYVYDPETFKTVYEADCVTILTSLSDTADMTRNDSGHELYNADGIRIVGKYVNNDSFWGTSVLLYIDNQSDKTIGISCEEMSINGFMVSPVFSASVIPGKYTIDDITIFSDDLEKNDIKAVENIELKFHIYDTDTYKTIVDTPAITFSVK